MKLAELLVLWFGEGETLGMSSVTGEQNHWSKTIDQHFGHGEVTFYAIRQLFQLVHFVDLYSSSHNHGSGKWVPRHTYFSIWVETNEQTSPVRLLALLDLWYWSTLDSSHWLNLGPGCDRANISWMFFFPKLYYPSNYPKPRSHIPNQAAGTKLSGRCDRVTNVPWRSMVGRWFISFWNSSIFGEIRSFSVVYELDDVSRTTFCVGPLVETSGKKRYRKKNLQFEELLHRRFCFRFFGWYDSLKFWLGSRSHLSKPESCQPLVGEGLQKDLHGFCFHSDGWIIESLCYQNGVFSNVWNPDWVCLKCSKL